MAKEKKEGILHVVIPGELKKDVQHVALDRKMYLKDLIAFIIEKYLKTLKGKNGEKGNRGNQEK